MQPVRIKYWGLLWITRPTYVVLQSIALFICGAVMVVGGLAALHTGTIWPHWSDMKDWFDFFRQSLVLLLWPGLTGLIAESIEMWMMLRKFARAEAEQRAIIVSLIEGEPPPTAPASTAVQSSSNVLPPNTNIQP